MLKQFLLKIFSHEMLKDLIGSFIFSENFRAKRFRRDFRTFLVDRKMTVDASHTKTFLNSNFLIFIPLSFISH